MTGNWQPLIDAAASLLNITYFALVIIGALAFLKGVLAMFDK